MCVWAPIAAHMCLTTDSISQRLLSGGRTSTAIPAPSPARLMMPNVTFFPQWENLCGPNHQQRNLSAQMSDSSGVFYSCHGAFVEGPGEQPQVLYDFKERNFSIYEPAASTFTMS